jgi:type I restriction enzyme S subunit
MTQPIPQGYKQTEIGVIPEDWEVCSIGSLITGLRGGAPLKPSDFTKNGVKVLPKGGVSFGGTLKIKDHDQQFCSQNYANVHSMNCVNSLYTIVILRDLVPSGPSIGLMVKMTEDDFFVLAQGVYGFLAHSENIANYLIHYSNSTQYRKLANAAMVGSTQVHITNEAFQSIKVALPPKPEQTAIATALSDVDALISGLESLIAKKQAIKTATMQQLLTGKTRLPPFAHHPDGTAKGYKQTELGLVPEDWGRSLLNDLCERISVGLATSVTKYYRKKGVPIIRNMNIKDGYFDGDDMLYLEPDFAKSNLSKAARALDVLTVHTGSNIGLTCVLPEDFDYCQTFTTLITTVNKHKLNPYYLSFHMGSDVGKKEITRLQVGGGKGNLNTGELKQYIIQYPQNIEEQSAIATILSDMDEEIQALEARLSKTKQIKQGMMQVLLTGKVRLVQGSETT